MRTILATVTLILIAVVAIVSMLFYFINFWWALLDIFVAIAVLTVIFYLISFKIPLHWYVAAFLAKYDFIFTNVPEGYFKEAVRFGGHRKTLLSKKGYKISDKKSDDGKVDIGDIVPLAPGEAPETTLPGGLRIIGWPFIDTIYRGEMKFLKILPNGDVKAYNVANVDRFYARVDYSYVLPFVKCEDKNNLPLLGHATLLAHVVNPAKSLFITSNFYDTMIGLVLPSVRECLKGFDFDEIKNKDDLDEIIWNILKEPNPDEPEGVIGRLRDKYGVVIVALRIVNIDPPEEYRATTLTKWKAEREADAARAVAKKQAEETEGRVIEAVARANGLTREELEEAIRACPEIRGLSASEGGLKEDFANARDLLKRDRAGDGLEDIRVGNADGTPLGTGIADIAAMIGLWKSKGSRRRGKNSGSGKGGARNRNKGKSGNKLDDADDDDIF